MFHHRRALRRLAAHVLLLWVFALAAGIANACVPNLAGVTGVTGATGSGSALSRAANAGHVLDTAADEDEAAAPAPCHAVADAALADRNDHGDGGAGHRGNFAKANCQDFCAKTSVSIPASTTALDDLQAHAIVATAAAAAMPAPAFVPVQPRVPRRDGAQGAPPILIAFLRLAL